MKRSRTAVCDWMLQLAAFLAVLFVLSAAHGAATPEAERMVIEEALRAGVSPSIALAVARVEAGRFGRHRWTAQSDIRSGIAKLRDLIERFPGRLDLALANYGRGREAVPNRHFAGAVRAWARRFDAEARAAAKALKAPPVARATRLDDFDAAITLRARRARRTLDDFPIRPRKG
jgi:hypothetical protein